MRNRPVKGRGSGSESQIETSIVFLEVDSFVSVLARFIMPRNKVG